MIKKAILQLSRVSDEQYAMYLLQHDPLYGKLTEQQQQEIIEKSLACGRQLAEQVEQAHGKLEIDELLTKVGVKLTEKEAHSGLEYIYFGTYQQPNKMTIYTENIEKGSELLADLKLNLFGEVALEDIIKAHELFHHFENQTADLYVQTHKITLWKFAGYEHTSKIIAASEIASMAFAKALLQVEVNPNILDVVLLYPHNKELAREIKDDILEAKGAIR